MTSFFNTVRLVVVALPVFLPATGQGEEGTVRDFTDDQGRVISAEIVLVKNGKVHFKRDGKSFQFPFAKLSKKDQDYLRQWVKANTQYWFSFQEKAVEQTDKRSSEGSGKKKTARSTERYELEIGNKSGVTVKGVKIKYQLAVRREWRGGSSKQEIVFMLKGEDEMPVLNNTKRVVMKLRDVSLIKAKWQVVSKYNVRYTDGSVKTATDFINYDTRYILDGIWVKLFIGERQIAEYKSGEKSIKNAVWNQGSRYDPESDLKSVMAQSKSSR